LTAILGLDLGEFKSLVRIYALDCKDIGVTEQTCYRWREEYTD